MSKNMRMPDREWSKNMWARIAALIDGQGQAIAGAIKAITFNGGNVPPDATGRVTFSESDPTVPAWAKQANPPAETDPTVPAWAKAATKPTYTASEVGAISTAARGAADGVASLDSAGKVPSSQLPSASVDLSQATGVLSVDHGGTGSTTKENARKNLGAAGALWYDDSDASTVNALKHLLLDDLADETSPTIVTFGGDITYRLTNYKYAGEFHGFIKYMNTQSAGYTFAYGGILVYNANNVRIIYGTSTFNTGTPDDTVTANIYEVNGTQPA